MRPLGVIVFEAVHFFEILRKQIKSTFEYSTFCVQGEYAFVKKLKKILRFSAVQIHLFYTESTGEKFRFFAFYISKSSALSALAATKKEVPPIGNLFF